MSVPRSFAKQTFSIRNTISGYLQLHTGSVRARRRSEDRSSFDNARSGAHRIRTADTAFPVGQTVYMA